MSNIPNNSEIYRTPLSRIGSIGNPSQPYQSQNMLEQEKRVMQNRIAAWDSIKRKRLQQKQYEELMERRRIEFWCYVLAYVIAVGIVKLINL